MIDVYRETSEQLHATHLRRYISSMSVVKMDLTALLEAAAKGDTATVTAEIIRGLAEDIKPSEIAGRVGLPAALGDSDGAAVHVIAAAGVIGDWIQVIAAGPEKDAEYAQLISPVLPLSAAFSFASQAIAKGLNKEPKLPEPLFPKDIANPQGSWGEFRDAAAKGNVDLSGKVIMGLYGSGTDYREIEGMFYYALNAHMPADGKALLAVTKLTQMLHFTKWGYDNAKFMFQWLIPFITKSGPEIAGAQETRDYLAAPEHDLDFIRTRLEMSKPEAANATMRKAIFSGSHTEVMDAVFSALKAGAIPPQAAMQVTAAAAEYLAGLPAENTAATAQALTALRVAQSARMAVTHTQDIRVLPILFHAANYVRQTIKTIGEPLRQVTAASVSLQLAGGLVESGFLRSLRRHLENGEGPAVYGVTERYIKMAFSARSIVGQLGFVAALKNIATDKNGQALLTTEAAGSEFVILPLNRQVSDGLPLLYAAEHNILAQNGDTALAESIMKQAGL